MFWILSSALSDYWTIHLILRCTCTFWHTWKMWVHQCWLAIQVLLRHGKNFNVAIFSDTLNVIIIVIINPLTVRVLGAPQMILQPVFSTFPCSPLPSGICWTPGLSIPWCCLPTFSSVRLVFFPLSLCLARWFWPDLMNGRHDHTTAVCVSLQSLGLRLVQLPAGSWHGLPCWYLGLCMRCVVFCGNTSAPWLIFFFGALPSQQNYKCDKCQTLQDGTTHWA